MPQPPSIRWDPTGGTPINAGAVDVVAAVGARVGTCVELVLGEELPPEQAIIRSRRIPAKNLISLRYTGPRDCAPSSCNRPSRMTQRSNYHSNVSEGDPSSAATR